MRKTHTRRLSVQKIILATKTRHDEWIPVVKAYSIGGPCIYLYLLCCFDPGGVVQGKQQEFV
jgi:hypothetical protein